MQITVTTPFTIITGRNRAAIIIMTGIKSFLIILIKTNNALFQFAIAIFNPSATPTSSPLYTFHNAEIKPYEKTNAIISATNVKISDKGLSCVTTTAPKP